MEVGQLQRDLVEQAQRGDRDAFAILARTQADRLMAIAQRILRDVGRAEDAVQQTLVICWRELPGLRDPDRFEGVVRPPNRALNRLVGGGRASYGRRAVRRKSG